MSLLWFAGSIVVLLILAFIILQLPHTQRFLTHKAETYLQGKLKTKVLVGEINLSFPKSIFLGDIYVESLQHDTLVFSHSLKVDIDMLGLLNHKITVNSLKIERVTAHIRRNGPDSSFNYSFIIKAFSDSTQKASKPSTSSKSKPYQIAVHGIYLHDFYVTYDDRLEGMDALAKLGKLDLDIRTMDLDRERFAINKIDLENTNAKLIISKQSPPDTSKSKPGNYKISIDNIKITGVNGLYKNTVSGQEFTGFVGSSTISNSIFQMALQKINIGSVILDESFASVSLNENLQANKPGQSSTTESCGGPGWQVLLDKLKIDNTSANYDDQSAKPVKQGVDFSHLGFKGINVLANAISYTGNKSQADITQLGLKERSGFAVHTFRTKLLFDSVETVLSDFDINTGNTHISKYIGLHYTSLNQLSNDLGKVAVNADVLESIIGYRDILYFVPSLSQTAPFSKDPNGEARVAGRINGSIGNLNLNNITGAAGKGTLVQVNGTIKNLPDIDKTIFDLHIPQMHTIRQDVFYFSPANTIPSSIHVPQKINATGYYKGSIHDFAVYLDTKTSMGNATAALKMKIPKNTKYSSYATTITTSSLQLGELLGQEKTLGPLTMQAKIEGSGLSLPDLNEKINAHITEATAIKYPYRNMNIMGIFRNQEFDGTATIKDSNVNLDFKGLIGIEPGNEKYDFVLNVEGANLKAVHLMDSDFRFKGIIKANITENKTHDINGTAGVTNVDIVKNNKTYPIRNFAFFSATHGNNDSISIRSDFINADFTGTVRVSQLATVLEAHLNKYFKLPNTSLDNYTAQKFKFHIDIGRTDLITDVFYPKIQKLATGPINGFYDSRAGIIKLNIQIPEIEYDNVTVDSLLVDVKSDPTKLNYDISIRKLNAGLLLKNIGFTGKIEHDSVSTTLFVKDDSGKTAFMMAAALRSVNDEIDINLLPKGVIINYEPWPVTADNSIKIGKDIQVHDLVLSHKNSRLAINSNGTPMDIDFKDFNLAEVTGWLKKDTLLAGGIVNGNISLKNLMQDLRFNVKLAVNDFSYKGDSVGNVKITADNNHQNRYDAAIVVLGHGNDASVKGFYKTDSKKPDFNFETMINSLTLKTIAPFASGELSDLGGTLKGKLLLSGSTDNLNITGSVHFQGAEFTLDYLNTHYRLDDNDILFNTSNIEFDDFKISDSANNKAIVNGYIYTKYFSNFSYNLSVKTDHFLALNSSGKKGGLFYGKLLATSQISIKGNLSAPVIDVNGHLEKGTFMTVILPGNEPSIESTKGVLFFSDINRPRNTILYSHKRVDTTQQTEIKGMEMTSNIEVDKDARLKVIVDPEAGDYLDVKGAGTLSMGMHTDGTITLTGRYEILEGSYQLTFYDFIKRRFTIQPGGSITWLGAPMEADLNLTAIYETRAAPLPILEPELTSLSTQERNQYLQQLRFQVLLKMTGAIKKPDLDMDITLNDLDKAAFGGIVVERLTEMELDKSEVNKQVFALLVLDRLIDENPFQSDQPSIAQSLAFTSVSALISQQLNNLSSKLLKHGSLSFDVRSYDDYSTGNPVLTNEFKATLQQQFLKDRLAVNLGGQLDVVGVDKFHPESTPSNQALSDISIEYMLTKDGRYRVTVFRDNTYAGLIEGQIVQTGAGLIFVKDFDSFNDIFDKPKATAKTNPDQPVIIEGPK